jgi:demethylmenaquinone methyltransferase / 2-methoxy-6-polyprenyl-1,4-benzoquinol methylase
MRLKTTTHFLFDDLRFQFVAKLYCAYDRIAAASSVAYYAFGVACDWISSVTAERGRTEGFLNIESNALSGSRDPDAVRTMFGSIARRYDLANHFLSFGCDFWWRIRAARIVRSWDPKTVVDLATGTGDLALALQRAVPDARVVGTDFSPEMLTIARKKGVRETIASDALALPFPDRSFDCLTIAFGLRNMKDWSAALREVARVLGSNGHLLVLEFSLPQSSVLRAFYRFYLRRFLPVLGSFLTRKKSAYDYLGESIEHFPGGAALVRLIEASGFADAIATPLTGSIVTIYTATRTN